MERGARMSRGVGEYLQDSSRHGDDVTTDGNIVFYEHVCLHFNWLMMYTGVRKMTNFFK